MSNHSRHTAFLMVLGLVGLSGLLAGPVNASEARTSALSENPMVTDFTDVVDYPGMLTVYGNSAFLTIFPGDPWGNAGALFGERVVVGAWVHRQSEWQDLDKTAEIYGLDLPDTHDILDFYIGTPVGFGLRLTLSAGLDSVDQLFGDSDLSSDGASTFGFEVLPGYSFDTKKYHGDFGLGLSFSHFQVSEDGEAAYTTGWIPSFLFKHRSIIGEKEASVAGVIDLTLTRRAYSAKSEDDDGDEGNYGHWVTSLIAGPRFQLPRNFNIWAGIRLELEHLAGEVGGDKQPTLIGIGAPGLMLSAELTLFNMFVIRAGVVYDIYWTIAQVADPTDEDEVIYRERAMGQRFNWSTGVGFILGDFLIDATVSQQLYFNGPAIIGGGNPGMFGMLSVTYLW